MATVSLGKATTRPATQLIAPTDSASKARLSTPVKRSKRSPKWLMMSVERRMSSDDLLDGDETLVLGQFLHVGDGHVDAVSDLVGIDHHRQVAGRRHRGECRDRLVRIGVVDRRGHHHQPVGAGLGRLLAIAAASRVPASLTVKQHRLPAGDLLGGLQHLDLLVVAEHWPFAERAADDDAVAAGLDLQREAALHLGMVELVVSGELGRDCWKMLGPHGCSPSDIFSDIS